MKTFALTTAVALALAAPAVASDQIARSLGLEPGAFTTAELAAIKGLVEDRDSNDARQIAELKARTGAGIVSTRSVPAPNQVAASLGLDAGQFTAAEVARIKGLVEDRDSNDARQIAELKSGTGAGVVSTRSVPAPSQVAASLGLDAGQFTAAEIARIKGLVEERDTSNASYIASLIAR